MYDIIMYVFNRTLFYIIYSITTKHSLIESGMLLYIYIHFTILVKHSLVYSENWHIVVHEYNT